MDNLIDFKKYFNSHFWRAFRHKSVFIDIPQTVEEKDRFIEKLYYEIIEKSYYPSNPHCFIDRDKGQAVTRIIPVFTVKDYCVYYYCIKKIEPKIAYNRIPNTFGGWTLGGLIRESEEDEMRKKKDDFKKKEDFVRELNGVSVSEYSYNPSAWSKAYGDLNAKLFATANESQYKYVVELDIANFYDNIRLDILEYRIREIASKEDTDIISLLFHLLNYWNRKANFYNKQTVGLPQDAIGDFSRILANFYLQNYDRYVYDLGQINDCIYLRFADDQFVFSDSLGKLEYMVFKLSKKLNTVGLSVNQNKVKYKTTQHLIEYRSYEIFDILADKFNRTSKEKVEEFADKYIEILDNRGLVDIKSNGYPLLNRLLFCPALKKIDFTKKTKLIACYLDDKYLKNATSGHFEYIYKLLTREDKLSFISKLIDLSEELIHNAFHYQVLDFFNKQKLDNSEIVKRIKLLENI